MWDFVCRSNECVNITKTESALDVVLKQRYAFNTTKQADGKLALVVSTAFRLLLICKTWKIFGLSERMQDSKISLDNVKLWLKCIKVPNGVESISGPEKKA